MSSLLNASNAPTTAITLREKYTAVFNQSMKNRRVIDLNASGRQSADSSAAKVRRVDAPVGQTNAYAHDLNISSKGSRLSQSLIKDRPRTREDHSSKAGIT